MSENDIDFVVDAFSSELDTFSRSLDPAWIHQALNACHKASIRRRRLPAEQAVWLVLMMGLLRDLSIKDVCHHLDIVLQPDEGYQSLAPSVLTAARQRLGEAPLRYLFHACNEGWLSAILGTDTFHGLHVLSVDGTLFRTPDSPDNAAAFGFIDPVHGTFPQVRMVGLMATHSHMLLDAAFGGVAEGELTLAHRLVSSAPDHSLTLFDRCYFSASFLLEWQQAGAETHWLTPVKSKLRYRVIERYSDYDMLIEMPVSPQTRKAAPHLPAVWQARMVSYMSGSGKGKITGFLTSMTDPVAYPLEDLLRIYWTRWEIELGYGELKRRQLKGEVTLRSRFPEGVKQELWGVLVSYNLLRKEMTDIAAEAGVAPTRISFVAALNILVSQVRVSGKGAAGNVPKHLKGMRENVKSFILPEKRKHRRYDRSVLYVPPKYPFSFKLREA